MTISRQLDDAVTERMKQERRPVHATYQRDEGRVVYYCGECGQRLADVGFTCTRCDAVCKHCGEPRRAHILVDDRLEICPRGIFKFANG